MSSTDDMPPPPGDRNREVDGRSSATPPEPPASKSPARDAEMGLALRSVYQQTVEEAVPDEMMDLLGKLG